MRVNTKQGCLTGDFPFEPISQSLSISDASEFRYPLSLKFHLNHTSYWHLTGEHRAIDRSKSIQSMRWSAESGTIGELASLADVPRLRALPV